MNTFLRFQSPVGAILAVRTKNGISRIEIGADAGFMDNASSTDQVLIQCKQQLIAYLAGTRREFDVPLDRSAITGFQAEVLRLTSAIPYGEVRTYGELARALGKPAASRAVGGALARNPLPILIPCHRVLAASGQLTGYSAANGIATKAHLLELEGHRVVGQKLG